MEGRRVGGTSIGRATNGQVPTRTMRLRHATVHSQPNANAMADEQGTTNPARLAVLFAQSGLAASIAETATLPLDTAKVRRTVPSVERKDERWLQRLQHVQQTRERRIERTERLTLLRGKLDLAQLQVRLQLQLLGKVASTSEIRKYRGPLQTVLTIAKEEGLAAPFKGWTPGIHRQVIFTGVRLGLYEKGKAMLAGSNDPEAKAQLSIGKKIAVSLGTSGLGITLANPSDVVKVRYQAFQGASRAGKEYSSVYQAYREIIQKEGLWKGLYRGYSANLARNMIISATEITVYDQTKQFLLARGLPDQVGLHLGCGFIAGLSATCLGSPMDVVGTKMMVNSDVRYGASIGSVVVQMLQQEGIRSFYKGFWPNFARVGSFNVVLWTSYEQISKLVDLMAGG